jgi:hypothetical protein
MRTDALATLDSASWSDPGGLDALAHRVADLLDVVDLEFAWSVTRTLEARVAHGPISPAGDEQRPPAPVIGRRFAVAHGALLRGAAAHASVGVAA